MMLDLEKKPRGRPRKNVEEGVDFDNTAIEGEGKPKVGRPAKTTVQKEIIADKLNMLGDAVLSMLGYEYTFTPADYNKESIALSNIAKEYNIVAKGLEILDPLFIICGLWQKMKCLKKKPKQEKKQANVSPHENVPRETYNQPPVDNVRMFGR